MSYEQTTPPAAARRPEPVPAGSGGPLWALIGGMVVAILGILWFLGVFTSAPQPATTTAPSVVIQPAPAAPAAEPVTPMAPAVPEAVAPAVPEPAPAEPVTPAVPEAAPVAPAPGN